MSSFYSQQSQTLFSANNIYHNQTVVEQRPVYYTAPRRRLPPDWIATGQPLPSVGHQPSLPPGQPDVPDLKEESIRAFPEEEILPPRFTRELSDPCFLLEKDSPKVVPLEPPRMQRELSDPSFLLEPVMETFKSAEVVDEWICDEQNPPPFQQERSKSSESGSSFGESTSKVSTEPYFQQEKVYNQDKQPERKEFVRAPKIAPAPFVQKKRKVNHEPKTKKEDLLGWKMIGTVQRRRKKRKTIEVGEVYRTKRYVKVTREEDPLHYGKPKTRRERDPNEVWTVPNGIEMEILEIRGKRAFIYCVVEFWSKWQDRSREDPRQKQVEGWISLKDRKGWVL